MFRKLFWIGILVVAGLFVLKKTEAGGLAQVWWKDAWASVERQVPPEVRLKQLNNEIDKIDGDIKKHLAKLADQVVACEKLENDVTKLRASQQARKETITELTKKLEVKDEKVSLRDTASKLERVMDDYDGRKGELRVMEDLLRTKKQTLDAARQKIALMREQKEELRVTAAKLETRLELARMKQVETKVDIDLTQVNRCNKLASKIESDLRKLEVQAELLVEHGYRAGVKPPQQEKPISEIIKKARQIDADETVSAREE